MASRRASIVLRVRGSDHQYVMAAIRYLAQIVNSDDPTYFRGYITQNFQAAERALGLTREDISQLSRNAFEASFLGPEDKRHLCAEVDIHVRGVE